MRRFIFQRVNVNFTFAVKCFSLENLLKNLLKKVETQEKLKEPTEGQKEKSKIKLQEVLKKHGIESAQNAAFEEALLDWKKTL